MNKRLRPPPDLHATRPAGKPANFQRAMAGYDDKFRQHLTEAIVRTIANELIVVDPRVMAIRTTETLDALVDALVAVMAMVPRFDTPSELRCAAEALAKRLRREVARARAEGVADRLMGARDGGHA